ELERALRQTERLMRLVEVLLDTSRIAAGRLILDSTVIDLREVARGCIERCRPEAEVAGCAVSLRAPGPVMMRGDPLRIDQVLTNLLSNAMKFGAGKPIEVT